MGVTILVALTVILMAVLMAIMYVTGFCDGADHWRKGEDKDEQTNRR